MNRLKAKVTEIQNIDNLNIVKFNFNSTQLTMMSLNLNKNIKVGKDVYLTLNPNHIALAKEFSGMLSFANKIDAIIHSCENGKLLSSIKLLVGDTILEAIITMESSRRMELKNGDNITIMIKASELSIAEFIDD